MCASWEGGGAPGGGGEEKKEKHELDGLSSAKPDEYNIEKMIGKGACGEVFLATVRGKKVAVKRVFRSLLSQDAFADFIREVIFLVFFWGGGGKERRERRGRRGRGLDFLFCFFFLFTELFFCFVTSRQKFWRVFLILMWVCLLFSFVNNLICFFHCRCCCFFVVVVMFLFLFYSFFFLFCSEICELYHGCNRKYVFGFRIYQPRKCL